MLLQLIRAIFSIPRYADYKPQKVTVNTFLKWLRQYNIKDWGPILHLFNSITYYSEKNTVSALVKLHKSLQTKFDEVGLPQKNVIYVQIHEAGSSSPVILNILRDNVHLEGRGCHFVDSSDIRKIYEKTNSLSEGAIIYVDDFSGTGHQFNKSHDPLKEYIIGNFSEFFLLPCICEEAYDEINSQGISVITDLIHKKEDRALHSKSTLINDHMKNRLIELCQEINKGWGLGYQNLATMVIFYRNAPNSVPLLIRGSKYQKPYRGVFPRTTDLPLD